MRTIGQVETRLQAIQQSMSQAHSVGDDLATSAMTALNSDTEVQLRMIPMLAEGALETAISSLNNSIEGRYLFSGPFTDTRPVADAKTILDGTPGRMGLREFMANRLAADIGAAGDGRLSAATAGAVTTVSHDGSPFGIRILGSEVNGANIAQTTLLPSATPRSIDFSFGAVSAGENIVLKLGLPGGETFDLQMTAISGDPPTHLDANQGVFSIGTTPAGTAASFQAALAEKISELVQTELTGASNMAAATEFFDGKPPQVPDATDPATATSFKSSSATVVDWFKPEQRPTELAGVLLGASDTPPGAPADGDTYAVLAGPGGIPATGAWAGNEGMIATWDAAAAAWTFTEPEVGATYALQGAPLTTTTWHGDTWQTTTPENGEEFILPDTNDLYSYNGTVSTWVRIGTAPEATDAIDSVSAKVDDATVVGYGVSADEDDLRNTLKNIAAMAATDFDANHIDRYHALVSRAAPGLAQSTTNIVEHQSVLGVVQERIDTLDSRHNDVNYLTKEQVNRIENVDEYEVATELLNAMTQLQATYQITGKLQQLTLANFL